MKTSLGDLKGNLEALRSMRDRLSLDKVKENEQVVEAERWGTLSQIAERIYEACEGRDLGCVASAVRDMKNKLRRPSIQKALREAEQAKKKPEGSCRCAKCHVVLNGTQEPCIEGALCPKCALKGTPSKDDKAKAEKAARKSAAKAGPPMGGEGGGGGSGGEEQEQEPEQPKKTEDKDHGQGNLRRRKYTG